MDNLSLAVSQQKVLVFSVDHLKTQLKAKEDSQVLAFKIQLYQRAKASLARLNRMSKVPLV